VLRREESWLSAVGGGEERTAVAVYIENLMGVPEKDSVHGAFYYQRAANQLARHCKGLTI